jgi:ABC-2 type transport system ATP-binding protein
MIQIENLDFNYGRRPQLFGGLNLSLDSGRIYGLLGRNGAGKTTLLKIMMGLLFPKSGSCRVLGNDSHKRKPAMLADMLFVPEEFYAPEMTIRRYVDLYAPFYPAFNCEQFNTYMYELQLSDREHFNSFSLGQKKKVVLAFALAANTRVLLMDEPTNGLDIPSKTQFRRMLASVAAEDRCIVISTHQVRDVENLIDAVVVLDNGQVILNRSVEDITAKLSFRTVPELTGQELYSESSIAGFQALLPNTDGEPTQIDLEILFNALTTNRQAIKSIFNR